MGRVIRLDIGSGHKTEEGWLTVDSAVGPRELTQPDGSRKQFLIEPDIACDVRAIPVPDDYADEARAIHVIEHFYAWEALAVMREWVRVIKPGGQLAIECPCLDKVLILAQVPQVSPDYVHWALYGDPRWREPAMCHKWAYTQVQLMKLMAGAGLVQIRPEPVRFHVPVRDMRVVGVKPLPESRIITGDGNG